MNKFKLRGAALLLLLCLVLVLILAAGCRASGPDGAGSMISGETEQLSAAESREETQSAIESEPEESSEPESEPEPVFEPVRLLAVGDNLIHDTLYNQAGRRTGGEGYDFLPVYDNVAELIGKADIAVINQETPLSASNPPSTYPMFNCPTEMGGQLAQLGFDVVNIANNHMLDKTSKGLAEAIDFWDATGLARTGAYKDTQDLESVEYIEKNGLKIGLVGITQYTNGLVLPSDSPLKYILTSDEATIERKIKAAKAQCDVVLVNVHWGSEYTTTPAQEQRNLAKKMADWGANVIIGHHPHVLQPVEWIENSDGTRTLVAYSLGNFISQQNTAARVIGGMLHYDITKDFETGKVTVSNVRFETIVTHYVSGSHDVQIYPLSAYSDTLAKKQAARIKQSDFSVAYIENFVKEVIPEEFLTA